MKNKKDYKRIFEEYKNRKLPFWVCFVLFIFMPFAVYSFSNFFELSQFDFVLKPEYIALLVSVIAIFMNVYISHKNRKHVLHREEFFKLQNMAEKIIAKLLILYNHQFKLKKYIELNYQASQKKDSVVLDINDTFNKDIFDRDAEEVSALIDIYFPDIGEKWNFCLDKIGVLYTQVFVLSKHLEEQCIIDWDEEIGSFNKESLELANKPKEISDKIKKELSEFKQKKL